MLLRIGLFACVLGCWVATASASSPTELEQWTAFTNGKLAAGIHVVQTASGSCSGGSQLDARADAWRCVSKGANEDPCFVGGGSFVICPSGTPNSHDALRLDLAGPPSGKANPSRDPTRHDPWVVVTATGAYCYRSVGTPIRAAGKAVSYQCAGAALLAGDPNRARAAWTIDLLPNTTASRYHAVAIATAWW